MPVEIDIGAAIGAAIAIGISIYTWRRTSKIGSYADLDLLYQEFLKLGIEHPRFREPSLTKDYKTKFEGEELLSYQAYAFMSWNICETIYDRCKGTKELWNTWQPVIVTENKLHRRWFDDPENFHKFKAEFRKHIQLGYPKEY